MLEADVTGSRGIEMNTSVGNDAHHNWDENITNNRLYYHMIQKIIIPTT